MSYTPPTQPADNGSTNEVPGISTTAIFVGFGCLLGLLLLISAHRPQAAVAHCRNNGAPQTAISGLLRLAGPDYYLVAGERWHLLQSRCNGKARKACLEATDHAEEWLDAHLGEAITANACAQGILDYTVANRRFFR